MVSAMSHKSSFIQYPRICLICLDGGHTAFVPDKLVFPQQESSSTRISKRRTRLSAGLRAISNVEVVFADPGVIVKSGVQAVESSGDLIDPCHLDTIFKFNSSNHLGQVVEST